MGVLILSRHRAKGDSVRAMLSSKQVRELKKLAHHKKPIVHVGKNGLTDGVLGEVNRGLFDHELIKVRFLEEDAKEQAEALAERSRALLVSRQGHVVTLYKQHPDEPKIKLPKA